MNKIIHYTLIMTLILAFISCDDVNSSTREITWIESRLVNARSFPASSTAKMFGVGRDSYELRFENGMILMVTEGNYPEMLEIGKIYKFIKTINGYVVKKSGKK